MSVVWQTCMVDNIEHLMSHEKVPKTTLKFHPFIHLQRNWVYICRHSIHFTMLSKWKETSILWLTTNCAAVLYSATLYFVFDLIYGGSGSWIDWLMLVLIWLDSLLRAWGGKRECWETLQERMLGHVFTLAQPGIL